MTNDAYFLLYWWETKYYLYYFFSLVSFAPAVGVHLQNGRAVGVKLVKNWHLISHREQEGRANLPESLAYCFCCYNRKNLYTAMCPTSVRLNFLAIKHGFGKLLIVFFLFRFPVPISLSNLLFAYTVHTTVTFSFGCERNY